MIVDLQKVQTSLEEGFITDVERSDNRFKAATESELTTLLNDFSNRQAKKMMDEWNKLDQYLLVKYIDGNVKKEEGGKFKRTEFGGCASPSQPEYPQWYYRMIVKDHGNIIEAK
jgi:hypothetical protein